MLPMLCVRLSKCCSLPAHIPSRMSHIPLPLSLVISLFSPSDAKPMEPISQFPQLRPWPMLSNCSLLPWDPRPIFFSFSCKIPVAGHDSATATKQWLGSLTLDLLRYASALQKNSLERVLPENKKNNLDPTQNTILSAILSNVVFFFFSSFRPSVLPPFYGLCVHALLFRTRPILDFVTIFSLTHFHSFITMEEKEKSRGQLSYRSKHTERTERKGTEVHPDLIVHQSCSPPSSSSSSFTPFLYVCFTLLH